MPIKGYIETPNGELKCDTARCNAVCCKATNHIPGLPGPCSELTKDNLCSLHTKGKPRGCEQYPRHQADIDHINKQAEAAGFTERCLLEVIS